MKKYQHFINGEYVDPIKGEWIDSENPYTGEIWAQIPRGAKDDVDKAVAAAKAAMTTGPFPRVGTISAAWPIRLKGQSFPSTSQTTWP